MIDEIVGSGEGECGKGMLWIGSPVDVGCGVEPMDESAAESATGCDDEEPAAIAADAGGEGVGMISEMTGSEAGSAGMPPYPSMP